MGFFSFLFKENKDSHQQAKPEKQQKSPTEENILAALVDCDDLTQYTVNNIGVKLVFFGHLIENVILDRDIIEPLNNVQESELANLFSRKQYKRIDTCIEAVDGILKGQVAILSHNKTYIVDAYGPKSRSITQSESESIITGAHDAFIEEANVNLSLIRRRLQTPKLKVKKFIVGDLTKSTVALMYIEGVANNDIVKELDKRISEVKVDSIEDANMLAQMIDEFPNSIFPQFFTTERPDVIVGKLVSGKIAGIVDHSPTVFTAPTNFFEFFESPDDKNNRWIISTSMKLMRYFAFIITLTFTALYVSATTYSYEVIPQTILMSLAESRHRVPFPPLVEALMLEIAIELLREAGVRLPTKIGQTIGIVGGIVIGQAAVDAGLVSNTLIIAVAVSAISSFVIPNYILSASLRIARFMVIILAGLFGNFGLIVGLLLLVIHLGGLTNLNTPYVNPIAPTHPRDWLNYFIRAPYGLKKTRPTQSISPNPKKR
ncbi:spore germination protein [Radiobacillus sp. PE A8.2]|uniref:spore germination protein n=1 Tax=Radiobacillus sp. PE A8.2 TaxID=3380349 RepID=UPI00388F5600